MIVGESEGEGEAGAGVRLFNGPGGVGLPLHAG
jgi:hypothetical protein